VLDEVGPGAGLAELFRWLHQPQSAQQWQRAGRVLGFEELVRMQEGLLRLRRRRTLRLRPSYEGLSELLQRYRRSLPFELNAHQNAALQEVAADLQADQAMSRMLTGDVGSGKTVVACFPLLVAAHHGLRGALLVPTEILARQHVETLRPILQEWQLPAPVLLSRGSDASAEEGLVLVGTHRLISARLTLPDLAVVVVDEQHKFGVRQRFHLWNKGVRPDLLLASATPIPRTLALTLFGHMDHSQLSEPVRPRKVTTEVLHGAARSQLADRIAQEAQSGGRVFVVCPAVARSSSRANLPSAEQMAPWLRQRLPPSCVVAMVHGRLDPKDKIDRLQEFAAGRCQVLVATVVVEVGLDIPDASMAVILGAERFGLAQLHQIRGRVGRSGRPASCLVVSAQPSTEVLQRLRSFAAVENGFELAERDLQQRGPGELLGLRQHGIFRTRFPVDFSDTALLERARDLARARLGGPKPLQKKEFRSDGVASDSWIW
jgi:ATP-dependent DNA helicase RecG